MTFKSGRERRRYAAKVDKNMDNLRRMALEEARTAGAFPTEYVLPGNQRFSDIHKAKNMRAYDTYQQALSDGTAAEFFQNPTGGGEVVPAAPADGLGSPAPNILGTAADVLTAPPISEDVFKSAKGGKGGLKGMFGNLSNTAKNAWGNIKAGKGVMPQYAGLAKGMAGAMAGLEAVQGISDYEAAKKDTDDLVNDILASAAGNSMYRYDLSADQLATLRKLQNGSYDTTGDFDMGSVLGNLGNIATGAASGFVFGGGVPGAVLGGLSGVIDGASSGMVGNQEQITADLQSLYDALYESEMRNKQMKRDAAYARYANSLY